MKFKGTPGQWIINDIDIWSEEDAEIAQVYDGKDTHISEMDMEVLKANAKLIAAAPELLEELKYLENYVTRSLTLSNHSKEEIEVILGGPRKAINKALK